MTDAFSIGWTEDEARNRTKTLKRVYAVNLIVQSVLAVLVIVAPSVAGWLLGVPLETAPFAAFWAGMVLYASALQVPLYQRPVRLRHILLVALLGRLAMAALFLSEGFEFWRFALFDAAFAVALIVLLQRAAIAEMQSRP